MATEKIWKLEDIFHLPEGDVRFYGRMGIENVTVCEDGSLTASMRVTAILSAAALLLAAVRPALAQTADNLKGQSLIIETGRQIKEKGTQEEMNHMMMTTRKIINSLTYLPLFIKVPIVQSVYGYLGNGIIGNTLSNLGLIKVPEEMASHIEKLYFILVPGMPNRATSSMVSFKKIGKGAAGHRSDFKIDIF